MSESDIAVTVKNNVQVIMLNRPRKKNAINQSMYLRLTSLLNEAANDEDITVCVLTGSGDYYSSGNDIIGNLEPAVDIQDLLAKSKAILSGFVEAFINFPKILIAIINGPALGIAATTLALCDIVYASDKAFIQTPFMKLGLSPEGCSSYTFPRLFGYSKATDMLLFGHKMTSEEALKYGLVSEIYSSDENLEKIWNKIYGLTTLPKQSLLQSKRMLKTYDKDTLMLANLKECNELEERWKSEEFMTAMLRFAKKSSKL